jgi:hypothetical protein
MAHAHRQYGSHRRRDTSRLGLFHAARAGSDTGVHAIASATNMSVDQVSETIRPLLKVSFPDLAPEDSRDWITMLSQAIEECDRLPCRDVRIKEATGIGFSEDASEYERWESRRNGHVLAEITSSFRP